MEGHRAPTQHSKREQSLWTLIGSGIKPSNQGTSDCKATLDSQRVRSEISVRTMKQVALAGGRVASGKGKQ